MARKCSHDLRPWRNQKVVEKCHSWPKPLWSGTNKNRDVSTGPLARPFARTAHLFACSRLLALFAPSAALTRSLARSLRSLPRSWEREFLMSQNDLVLSHSGSPEKERSESKGGMELEGGNRGKKSGKRGRSGTKSVSPSESIYFYSGHDRQRTRTWSPWLPFH